MPFRDDRGHTPRQPVASLLRYPPVPQRKTAEARILAVLWQYWGLNGRSESVLGTGSRPLGVHAPLLDSAPVKARARELGFDLVGVAPAAPTLESAFYPEWLERGFHGEMAYLEGRRGVMRGDPRTLMPSARSLICVGLVYNTPEPYSTEFGSGDEGWVSRYAWGEDYHRVLKERLRKLADWIRSRYGRDIRCRVCVDTSPLLERAYAHRAGLGWIGKNTCLIDERLGSWVFLGEILTSLELATDDPAPFRCGTCRRCIDACPTDAFVEIGDGPSHALDSRRCISYWTIELRGPIPEDRRKDVGQHLFGCDICQDVCPWNTPRRAAVSNDPAFRPENARPNLNELARLSEEDFNERFEGTPIERSRYSGFLRNVAVAMGNSADPAFQPALEALVRSPDAVVREHAGWALREIARHAPAGDAPPRESQAGCGRGDAG